MNQSSASSLATPGLVAPRRWDWFIEGESGLGLMCTADIKDGRLCWHRDADHDVRRGSEDSEQSTADFLSYGPENASPPEYVAREMAAHLGLDDPPWLRPLDSQIASFLILARRGDVAGLKQMLGAGMNVNAADRESHTALWHAVDARQAETIQLLLDAGADATRIYRHGQTLLMLAAQKENLPLAQHLLARGLEVNARDEYGANALLHAVNHVETPLSVFQALVEAGADSLPEAFVKAARNGASDIVRYLIAMGVDVNARTADGWTPFLASMWGGYRPEMAEELLAAGGDPCAQFPGGSTVLHAAAAGGYRWLNMLRAALRAGVDVNARDGQGRTALMRAVSSYDSDQIVRELIEADADLNARNGDGETALCCASYGGRPQCLKALIEAGADPNPPCQDGTTVLFRLSSAGDPALIEALLRAGADPNAPQPGNHTALHNAARSGHVEAINLLLKFGADANAREQQSGRTPLWYACVNNKLAAFNALVAAGGELEGE